MPKPRIMWMDAARGLCVIAIVLMHFIIWAYRPNVGESIDVSIWNKFNGLFGAFRLPVLFAISGLLVSDRIRAGWGDRRNAVRVASSYYLYVVWLCIYGFISMFLPSDIPGQISSVESLIRQLLLPRTILWFILALAVYVIVLTSLKRVPPAIVLTGLALLSILSIYLPGSNGGDLYLRVVYYAFFFAVGIYLRPALLYFATAGLWWKAVGAGFIFLVMRWAGPALADDALTRMAIRFVRDGAAVFAGIAIVAMICRATPVGSALASIGRNTLPIFVLQMPILWLIVSIPALSDALAVPALRSVAPLVGTTFIVLVSLGLHALMMRTPLRHLFKLPTRRLGKTRVH
jgi:uncharacterized membrane protein YcfT